MHNIYIFSEAVHSGKTTTLQQWLRNRDNQVSGLLSPDKDGKRMLYDIGRKEYIDFEVGNEVPADEIVLVGKYRFSKNTFTHAQEILRRAVAENPEWLIVDEVGKLELEEKKGLEPALSEAIRFYQSGQAKGKLILVIRNYLLNEAVSAYGLNTDMIVHKSFFE